MNPEILCTATTLPPSLPAAAWAPVSSLAPANWTYLYNPQRSLSLEKVIPELKLFLEAAVAMLFAPFAK
jgi:hypothetical protein